jgi:hypothetical protein
MSVQMRTGSVRVMMVAALLCAAGSARAADQEAQTYPGPFPMGDSSIVNPNFAQAFTGGAYTPIGLRVRGTINRLLAGTQGADVRVRVEYPGGSVLVNDLQLATSTASTVPGSVTFNKFIPIPTGTMIAGTWVFTFSDVVNQVGGPDCTISDLVISAVDNTPATDPGSPPVQSGPLSGTGALVLNAPIPGDPAGTPPPGELREAGTAWFTLDVDDATFNGRRYLDLTTNGSLPPPPGLLPLDTEMGLYTQGGVLLADDDEGGRDNASAFSFGVGSATDINSRNPDPLFIDDQPFFATGQDGELPTGRYFVGISQFNVRFRSLYQVERTGTRRGNSLARLNLEWGNRTVTAPTVAPADELGLNPSMASPITVSLASDEVKWFRFRASGVNVFNRGWIDVDTSYDAGETVPPGALAQTALLIYSQRGRLIAGDIFSGRTSGTTERSLVSLGTGSGLELGDVLQFNPETGEDELATYASLGQDGGLDNTDYYLGVLGRNETRLWGQYWTFRNDPLVPVPAGTTKLRLTSGTQPAPGGSVPQAQTLTLSSTGITVDLELTTDAGAVKWFRFNNPVAASVERGRFVDIWTSEVEAQSGGTQPLSSADTVLAIYALNGAMVLDDNFGLGLFSAMSFGQDLPVRRLGDDIPLAGQDGVLPVGEYILGVAAYNVAATNPAVFSPAFVTDLSPAPTASGRVRLTISTGGGRSCGPSDVASPGPVEGADGVLSADDIIFYIGLYFASDPRADVAGPGQTTGADGTFSADDIIAFIQRFFDPGQDCTF